MKMLTTCMSLIQQEVYQLPVGTAHWMSPEAAERKPHDLVSKAASDVWYVFSFQHVY